MNALAVLAHHSETTDSTLLTRLVHTIYATVGRDPLTMVLATAVVVLSILAIILVVVIRRERRLKRQSGR